MCKYFFIHILKDEEFLLLIHRAEEWLAEAFSLCILALQKAEQDAAQSVVPSLQPGLTS